MRRPCFVEDDGLASIVGVNNTGQKSGALMVRRNSLRIIGSLVSRSTRLFDEESHFLQACFLCRKNLGLKNDIFMYRGDTPFCSEECRQEQIDIDELAEKNKTLKAFRKIKDSSKSSSSSSSSPAQSYSLRTGAVTAS